MADKAEVAMLKQGTSAWNEWRATHALTRLDLANARLCGLDLVEANLAGADLRNADLRGTVLSRANLVDANLAGADFFKAVLDGADLSGANLVGAQFLICPQLVAARNWQSALRDLDLACGAPIPRSHDGS
jgi:uncharacterized protein YjbI with pentapeptide repeats